MRKKTSPPPIDMADAVEKRKHTSYLLRLYVAGATKRSAAAIRTIKSICDEHLKDRYTLEVVDVGKNPERARGDQIVALPTLVKELPAPVRKLIGDMADKQKVLLGLVVTPTENADTPARRPRQ